MLQPANAAIYGTIDAVISVDKLRKIAEDADSVAADRDPLGNIAQFTIQWPDLQILMKVMPQQEIPDHLQGFVGYARHLSDGSPAHENVIHQIRRVRIVHGLTITPGWDDQGRVKRVVLGTTMYYQGLFFAANSIYDGANQLRLGPPGARKQFFIEKPQATSASLLRKQRSEAILKAEGVPYIDHLPVIEDESEIRFRLKEEIARRAVALALVASRGEGLEFDRFRQLVNRFGAESWFSPNERMTVFKKTLTDQERLDCTWRYEACAVLLWALGYIRDLGRPDHTCVPAEIVRLIAEKSFQEFMDGARPRSTGEILDQADLIYRYAWATEEARLHGDGEPPSGLESGVVYERHYTLNWLIGYFDLGWDDVSTDT